ncbi:MAG: MBL fold metallo-hydrolase [Isosphaeraceae bacterium]
MAKAKTKTSFKTATKSAKAPRSKPAPPPGVTVRMYCQGLGDCFLLSFPPASGTKRIYVLIDCGVFQQSPGESDKLRQVVQSIRDVTDGSIDLLIVTHEHWDHISGFSHANDLFSEPGFEIKNVWMSWIENPDDPDARVVKAALGQQRMVVGKALEKARLQLDRSLKANGDDQNALRLNDDVVSAESVLGFFGPRDGSIEETKAKTKKPAKPADKTMDLGATMNWLRTKVRPGNFCSPGECRPLPGTEGIQVYVLGPPRSLSAIRKQNPSKGQSYGLQADRVSILAALDWLDPDKAGAPPGPFGDHHRLSPEDARLDPYFLENYGFPDDPLGDAGPAWRRIDDEWLGGFSRLALQLDTGVNNTSLALAFELPNGQTLIFPGDAQIGNWLSWSTVTFRDRAGKSLDVTTQQLLNRAVLYKVGHHGSHNATLKPGGLEAMTGSDLVAMIPTDEAFAKTKRPPRDGWKMPKAELNEALMAFTHHRILRADQGEADLDAQRPPDSPFWNDFRARVRFADEMFTPDPKDPGPARPLYIEYTIQIEDF